jgi:hypothetical protein
VTHSASVHVLAFQKLISETKRPNSERKEDDSVTLLCPIRKLFDRFACKRKERKEEVKRAQFSLTSASRRLSVQTWSYSDYSKNLTSVQKNMSIGKKIKSVANHH